MMFGYYKITFMCSLLIVYVVSTTHWVITENDLIQPRKYSPFNLRRPYDLINFLEQQNRRTEIVTMSVELAHKKDYIESKWSTIDDTLDIETKLYNKDMDCISAGMKLSEIDLFMTVISDGTNVRGIDQSEVDLTYNESPGQDRNQKEPDCKKNFDLPFSMFAYEHLPAMIKRYHLSMNPETGIFDLVLPKTIYLKYYGNEIHRHLQSNSSSWLHYNMAALYWRMKGDAPQALECARRAVYFSPRRFRDITLLNMGGIFHNTKNPIDAAIVLQAAIDHSPNDALHYLALGNVFTSIADYNKSISCYDSCLKINGDFKMARISRHAILCHQKVVENLVYLHESLKSIVADLHDFWRIIELVEAVHDEAIKFTSLIDNPNADELYSNFNFKDCNKVASIESNTEMCRARNSVFKLNRHILNSLTEHFKILFSEVQSKVKKITAKMKNTINLNGQKSGNQRVTPYNFQGVMFGDGSPRVDPSKDEPTEKHVKNEESDILKQKDSVTFHTENKPNRDTRSGHKAIPKKKPKNNFPEGKHKYSAAKSSSYFAVDWPAIDDCMRWKNKFPQEDKGISDPSIIVIPLENKGLNLSMFLSDYIGVPASDQHPLPWHSPICCSHEKKNVENYFYLSDKFKSRSMYKELPPDERSRQLLLHYVTNGNNKIAENMTNEEIGQRILTLFGMNLLPPWVSSWLSLLYWSARGGPDASRNMLNCAICCIKAPVPSHIRDFALIPIGSILQLFGQYSQASAFALEAVMINSGEPSTNYLISLIQHSVNMSDLAIFYLKMAVRMDYNYRDGFALTLLKKWLCEPKLATQYGSFSKVPDPETSKGSQLLCTLKVVKHEPTLQDMETINKIKKGLNSKFSKETTKTLKQNGKRPIKKVSKHLKPSKVSKFVLQLEGLNSINLMDPIKEMSLAFKNNMKHLEENVQPVKYDTERFKESLEHVKDNIERIEKSVQPVKDNKELFEESVQRVRNNIEHLEKNIQFVRNNIRHLEKSVQSNVVSKKYYAESIQKAKDKYIYEHVHPKTFDTEPNKEDIETIKDHARHDEPKVEYEKPTDANKETCNMKKNNCHNDDDIVETQQPHAVYKKTIPVGGALGEPLLTFDPVYLGERSYVAVSEDEFALLSEGNMTECFCNMIEESRLTNMEAILQTNDEKPYSDLFKFDGPCQDIRSLFVWPSSNEINAMLLKRGIKIADEIGRFGKAEDKKLSPNCPRVISKYPVVMFTDDVIKLFPILTTTISRSEVPVMENLFRVLTRQPSMSIKNIGLLITNTINMNGLFWPGSAIAAIYWRFSRQPLMYVACMWSALALAPKHHKDIIVLAVAVQLQREGYYSEALELAKLAFRMEPRSPWNGYVVGLLFAVQGDFISAKRLFKYVLSYDEETTRAKEALAIAECSAQGQVNSRKR